MKKNDRRVVFARRKLTKRQRFFWAFYLRVLLEANATWLAHVSYVYQIHLRETGGSYMRGIRGYFAATNIYGTWGISSGMTTYSPHYWTATTS